MGARRTFSAAVVFALLLAALIYDGRRLEIAEERRLAETRLFAVSKDEISGISIVNRGLPLALRKENDRWKLIQPLQTAADPQTVADLLFYLDAQTKSGATKVEETELATYGLAKPALSFTVRGLPGSEETRVLVGDDSPAFGWKCAHDMA